MVQHLLESQRGNTEELVIKQKPYSLTMTLFCYESQWTKQDAFLVLTVLPQATRLSNTDLSCIMATLGGLTRQTTVSFVQNDVIIVRKPISLS